MSRATMGLAILIAAGSAFAEPAFAERHKPVVVELLKTLTFTLRAPVPLTIEVPKTLAFTGRSVLAGLWVSDDGAEVRITHNEPRKLEGKWEKVSDRGSALGFKKGNRAFDGQFDGRTVKGRMSLRYPKTFKGKKNECSIGAFWDRFELVLSDDEQTLAGKFKSTYLDFETCRREDRGWKPISYKRKGG